MRRLVVGDIHGRSAAFEEVLSLSKFDKESDLLIVIGDVVDGDVGVPQILDYLLTVKNLVLIKGNHDAWFVEWCTVSGEQSLNALWWNQGGMHTAAAYDFKVRNVPLEHVKLLQSAVLYYVVDGMIFVHGGFNPLSPVEGQDEQVLTWDRELINFAMYQSVPGFKKVFVGHTTTQLVNGETVPQFFHNLVMVDTGAGWTGKLTIMDVDTLEFWQSCVQTPGPSKNLLKSLYYKTHMKPLSKRVVG